jgi:homoserine dehydrogenase
VLGEIATTLAEHGVSISSMIQRGRAPGETVAIVMMTHEVSAPAVSRALKVIAASDKVSAPPCMIPMEAG